MGMNALTDKALETLTEDILQRLLGELKLVRLIDADLRRPSDTLQFLFAESYELLQLMSEWAGIDPRSGHSTEDQCAAMDSQYSEARSAEISDDDAIMMLDNLDQVRPAHIPTTEPDSQNLGQSSKPEGDEQREDGEPGFKDEMPDAAAMAALEAMDSAAPADESSDTEMSDAAAMAALEAMESAAPVDESSDTEMSDAAAMAALEAMDSAAPVDESSDTEMSDAAAMAALEAMDNNTSSNKDTHSDVDDVDSETLAMLSSLDTDSDTASPSNDIQQATPIDSNDKSDNDPLMTVEGIGEIPEFGSSEFGSDPEMIRDFMENAVELIDSLDEQILILESDPINKDVIEEIFRAAHTLKGAAGMFGYLAIERVMHRMENFFDQIRRGKLVANPNAIDVILRGIDVLKTLMTGIEKGEATGFKTAPIVLDLTLLGEGKYTQPTSTSPEPGSKQSDTIPTKQDPTVSEQASPSANSDSPPKKTPKKKEVSTIRVDLERLDALVNLVGELVTDRTRFLNIEDDLRTKNPQLTATHNMSQTVQLFGRHMNEIQDTIMKVRMVPIGNAFNKFTRIIRDLSRQLGKEIELVIEGEHTELDKTLVEQIADPLVHLIRNSCDHGVEMPDKREANGKKRLGTIILSARQEGNQILITIEDDGNGIDADIIRKKGIEKGLISEDDNLTNREIFGLIFASGFSTAAAVTNISGRGVGMDVVKKQIGKLKGMIDISSELGKGTTITIQLPLTLAIVQSLVVKSRSEMFAIPLTSVVESLRISPKDIQKIGDNEVIKRRNEVLPLLYLEEILDLKSKDASLWYRKDTLETANEDPIKTTRSKNLGERLFVVVVGTAERRFGVVVDNLLNQQEMVIKPMGNLMQDIPCIAGGAILGSGEVVLVLDTGQMDEMFRSKSRTLQAA